MSVDPYMLGRMSGQNTYVQGFELGRALEGAAWVRSSSRTIPCCARATTW